MKTLLISFVCCLSVLNSFGQSGKYDLKITHLTGDLYVFVSYGTFEGKHYPANAMYMVTPKGVVLFDTPWESQYYQALLDSIWNHHHKKVIMCISTHFHDDRTSGLTYYNSKGIKTYTTAMTDSLSVINHNHRANYLIHGDTTFHVGGNTFETYYPGPGHSPDNIVIWFPKEKVLYGGCLIKSVAVNSLGNLGDANVKAWGQSLKKLQKKFSDPSYMIVGHNKWRNKQSIKHTLYLISTYKKTQP